LHIWRGEMKEIYGPLPRDLTFGHEMCGRVERLGTGVSFDSSGQPLREGDRVAFVYFFPCGRCPVCLRGELGSCPRKGRANRVAGTPPYFNNAYGDYYYLRPGAAVFRIPDEVSDDIATPANCALAQVLYGLTRAGVRLGDTVVIQGAGGLGLNAVAVARDLGADRVIVLDRVGARLELARAFGADHTLSFLRRNLTRFPFARLVSHVYPFAAINDAFREADWQQRGNDGLRISRAALAMTD